MHISITNQTRFFRRHTCPVRHRNFAIIFFLRRQNRRIIPTIIQLILIRIISRQYHLVVRPNRVHQFINLCRRHRPRIICSERKHHISPQIPLLFHFFRNRQPRIILARIYRKMFRHLHNFISCAIISFFF